MLTTASFDYAVVRVVPRVERGEFINVGVVLFCRTLRFLAAPVALDHQRLLALDPQCDPTEIAHYLNVFSRVAAGEASAGPIALLPVAERFHWLVAPRSSIVQVSPVHSGVSAEPHAALEHLMATMVQVSSDDKMTR